MKRDWWDKNPSLIIFPKMNILKHDIKEDEVNTIENFFKEFYFSLSEYFRHLGSEIIIYNKDSLIFKNGINLPYGIILNPVLLGNLPENIINSKNNNFSKVLRDEIPEVYPPFAISIGRDLLNISPAPHPNFINVIFIRDENNFIINLPYEKKINLFRIFMAKLGAFKNIIITYSLKNKILTNYSFILSTLEGGCPILKDINELGRRLRIFGSCKEVGGYLRKEVIIPQEEWKRSSAVNSIINIGRFLGDKNLLSPPVSISDLVKGEKLSKFITTILSYSRQAEGAFMAYDSILKLFVVTASGKYNVDKANLSYKDLVPVYPTSDGKVEVYQIEGIDVKGPSVEAEEFTLPLKELMKEYPPIIGIIHIHRGIEYYDSEEIVEIPQDLETYPPVGCGVDLMHAMSKYAMINAVKEKEKKPNIKIAVFSVPNHGTNIYSFYEDNIINDSFFYIKKFINEGKLKFRFDVPQV